MHASLRQSAVRAQHARLVLLLAATLAWLWAISPYAPRAADRAPRLWLYDLLFYVRAVLLAWTVAEIAFALFRGTRRSPGVVALLGTVLAAWLGAAAYDDSGVGWRWRVRASGAALAAVAQAGDSDQRQRVGHLLIDTVRTPCGARSPWLWLGRPHGGGSGINLALVRGNGAVPRTPVRDAFVFLALGEGWWLAYENAARHHAAAPQRACTPGTAVGTHRAGLAHVAASR